MAHSFVWRWQNGYGTSDSRTYILEKSHSFEPTAIKLSASILLFGMNINSNEKWIFCAHSLMTYIFVHFYQNLYWLYLCHETKQDLVLYIVLFFYSRVKVADMDYDQKCLDIAKRTEGLSGREISKLGVAWQVWQLCLLTFFSLFWSGRIVQHIHSLEGNNIISEFEACVGDPTQQLKSFPLLLSGSSRIVLLQ